MSSSTEASDLCMVGQHECCHGEWFEGPKARPGQPPEDTVIGFKVRCGCPCHAADRAADEDARPLAMFSATQGAALARFAARDLRMLDENVRHAISAAWLAGCRAERERKRS